jgi:hypothetical protein
MKGNVLDMAIGIIIGTAFGAIVKSLVQDILMPPIGLLLGKIDFANLFRGHFFRYAAPEGLKGWPTVAKSRADATIRASSSCEEP